MHDALDILERPAAVTLASVIGVAKSDFADWLNDRRNRRIIPHRFEACGYAAVRNPDRKTGLWVIDGSRAMAYANAALSLNEQIKKVQELRGVKLGKGD